jgi:hypothetical protein
MKTSTLVIAVLFFCSSCTRDKLTQFKAIPTAFGSLNEIVVISSKQIWDGPVGDSLRYYYSSAFPILPQPEPIFDLRHFTTEELESEPMRKELRNYLILADLSDFDDPTTKMVEKDLSQLNNDKSNEINSIVGRDKWAKGQLIIYQFAKNEQNLIYNIKKDFPAIQKKVYDADRYKLDGNVYQQGIDENIINELNNELSIYLKIPKEYGISLQDDVTFWLRKETENVSSNILISKIAYQKIEQLSTAGLKEIRDKIGKKYISSQIEDSYMRTNDIDLPIYSYQKTLNNKYTIENRGIWEMENDYMGGPYISYLVLNEEKSELLFLDGFVYAPGQDKRELIMSLEHIFKSLKWN